MQNCQSDMPEGSVHNQRQIEQRARRLFDNQELANSARVDHWFAALLLGQWLVAVVLALRLSPLTWVGFSSQAHVHVWAAIFLGGAVVSLPLFLIWRYPGRPFTRHIVAITQMLFSVLFIHLSGGRIETHFHVFGSLAFLAFYRDWRVLICAALVVAIDHGLRGFLAPQSVYGVLAIEPLRWLEHTGWVIFEEFFLIKAVLKNREELWNLAFRQAEAEASKLELQRSQRKLALQYQVSDILARHETLEQCAPHLIQAICRHTPCIAGSIWEADEQTGHLYCCGFWKESNDELPAGAAIPGAASDSEPASIEEIDFSIADSAREIGRMRLYRSPSSTGDLEFRIWAEAISKQISQFILRRQSESRCRHLAAIVESCDDAIIGKNLAGDINIWNAGAERMFGYPAEEAVGKHISMLVPRKRADENSVLLMRMEAGETIENYETVRVRKDGSHVPVALTLSPIFDRAGFKTGTSSVLRDITTRIEAEKRVSEFYSIVSHELRTPMTAVSASLKLLQMGALKLQSDQGLDLIDTAVEGTDRLIRLINDILDLQKLDAGKLYLNCRPVCPELLVTHTLSQLRSLSQEAQIELRALIEADPPVRADFDRITQVLTNLVANAIKFTPAGGAVTVGTRLESPGTIKFLVKDNGPGISRSQMGRLFEKFQQLDSSDSRSKGGTGLGLAISKAIVEEHGGRIGVDSQVGVGSEFWFELPLLPVEADLCDTYGLLGIERRSLLTP